jgi:ornithine carbamoyltransferase
MNGAAVRHLLSIEDLSDDDLQEIITSGGCFAAKRRLDTGPLAGAVVGILFRQTSTRTRTAFSTGALRLGAQIVTFQPGDLQTNTGETLQDTARVLASMLDVLVVRTAADPGELRTLAASPRMAVINAMSPGEHPTQAITDLLTIKHHFGRLEGLRVLYLGEGNNTAVALALALSRFPGVHLELRTPPGYGLPAEIAAKAAARAAVADATITERHHMNDLPAMADVIYTTRWQTTGSTKPDPGWRKVFEPFRVEAGLWRASPKAMFLHDLPAHRGEEVSADVLDGPMSLAFLQAEFKLYGAMAVLQWCDSRRSDGVAGQS